MQLRPHPRVADLVGPFPFDLHVVTVAVDARSTRVGSEITGGVKVPSEEITAAIRRSRG